MVTPQSLTQGFLQSNTGVQTAAQNALPVLANNGNPNTIYNQVPSQGGYLPPVANAYDQWRINPMQQFGGGFGGFNMGNPMPNSGFGGGNYVRGGTLPVLPPPTTSNPPPATNQPPPVTMPNSGNGANGNMYPVGSGGWMLGGPTPSHSTGGGSLNTSYTNRGFGFGLFTQGYNGMNGGGNTPSGGAPSGGTNYNGNGWLSRIADAFVPGDAFQTEGVNYGNIGMGLVDRQLGLPVSWLANRVAGGNWAQTSDSRVAQWLRGWRESNDREAMHQYYNDPANGTRAGGGWLDGAFDYLNPGRTLTDSTDIRQAFGMNFRPPVTETPEQIYASRGVQGLAAAGYNSSQINDSTRHGGSTGAGSFGGMGIGLHASGAFTPGMADVAQGDHARSIFGAAARAQAMTPTFQRHNNEN